MSDDRRDADVKTTVRLIYPPEAVPPKSKLPHWLREITQIPQSDVLRTVNSVPGLTSDLSSSVFLDRKIGDLEGDLLLCSWGVHWVWRPVYQYTSVADFWPSHGTLENTAHNVFTITIPLYNNYVGAGTVGNIFFKAALIDHLWIKWLGVMFVARSPQRIITQFHSFPLSFMEFLTHCFGFTVRELHAYQSRLLGAAGGCFQQQSCDESSVCVKRQTKLATSEDPSDIHQVTLKHESKWLLMSAGCVKRHLFARLSEQLYEVMFSVERPEFILRVRENHLQTVRYIIFCKSRQLLK